MQKFIIAGAVVIVLLVGAYLLIPKSQTSILTLPEDTPISPSKTTPTPAFTYGPFVGTLPCADCSGLETKLTLTKNSPYTDEGTYILSENYLGKSVKPIITKGNWTMIRGDATNPNASVFQLDPDKKNQSTYYLKVNDQEIEMLSSDLKKIDSPFPNTLKKI